MLEVTTLAYSNGQITADKVKCLLAAVRLCHSLACAAVTATLLDSTASDETGYPARTALWNASFGRQDRIKMGNFIFNQYRMCKQILHRPLPGSWLSQKCPIHGFVHVIWSTQKHGSLTSYMPSLYIAQSSLIQNWLRVKQGTCQAFFSSDMTLL